MKYFSLVKIILFFLLFLFGISIIDKINVRHEYLIELLLVIISVITVLLIIDFKLIKYFKFQFQLNTSILLIILIGSIGLFLFNYSMRHLLNLFIYDADILEFSNKFVLFDIIVSLLIAPIIEEFLFRKAIISKLNENFKNSVSLIISSLLFGVYHSENQLYMFLGGLFLGYIYLKTNNILYTIIAHFLYNLVVLIFFSFNFYYFMNRELFYGSILVVSVFFLTIFFIKFNTIKKTGNI